MHSDLAKISEGSKALRKHIINALAGKEPYIKAVSAYDEFLNLTNNDNALLSAFIFALERHEGQHYQWKNKQKLPYSYHISKCAINSIQLNSSRQQIIIALWHDLIEDKRATSKEIAIELKNRAYAGIEAAALITALQILDKNGISKENYFSQIIENNDALIAKAADICSNLDECIARLDEMLQTKQRFWIYDYLIELPELFLNKISAKAFPSITNPISKKISFILSSLPEKNRLELEEYSKEALKQ